MTRTGVERTKDFIQKSNPQIEKMISTLPGKEYVRLMKALIPLQIFSGNIRKWKNRSEWMDVYENCIV